MINLYVQCAKCMEELKLPQVNFSPEEYQKISAGLTEDGECLQIWCERHQLPVLTMVLSKEQLALFGHKVCEVCGCEKSPE